MTEPTAPQRFELEVGFTNPYKGSKLFIKEGRAFFGRWRPPPVKIDGDEPTDIVTEGLEGQLDSFATKHYGDRSLWRVIAQANLISHIHEEVVAGLEIIIPKLPNVDAALLKTQARGARVVLGSEAEGEGEL
jgi:hypothetical protein